MAERPSERAMKAAVEMEIHAACSTTTVGKGAALDKAFPAYDEILAALKALLDAATEDFGTPSEGDEDNEAVGGGMNDDGSPDPMTITFGHLRRASAALAKATS